MVKIVTDMQYEISDRTSLIFQIDSRNSWIVEQSKTIGYLAVAREVTSYLRILLYYMTCLHFKQTESFR
uniref:Uncharacterized protein n=1 Tax=Anguilla anguilla TaxID=7936 RepID=A0A0E9RQD7_ANGAN